MTSAPRNALAAAALVLLACAETGLVASVPGPLRALPLVLAVGVYLVQLRGWRPGIWLIAGFGLLLDLLGIGPSPAQTLAYGAAAFVVAVLSERLFSNRSLYGILGCGIAGWAAWALVTTAIWIAVAVSGGSGAATGPAMAFLAWRLAWLLLLLTVLFYLVPRRTRLLFGL